MSVGEPPMNKPEERCPNCGYCPHCGQSKQPLGSAPVIPYVPYYPPIRPWVAPWVPYQTIPFFTYTSRLVGEPEVGTVFTVNSNGAN